MNRPRRDRPNRSAPPVNRVPKNLAGTKYIAIQGVSVGSYTPEADGQGQPTQVHLKIEVAGGPPFVMRIKSARACDEIIAALERHRNDVWPQEPVQ